MTRYLHVTVDGKTPLCGRHKAHPDEEFVVSKKLSMDLCERLGVDLCDMCMYVIVKYGLYYTKVSIVRSNGN